MATAPDQKPSIAPIVGPDDERRFTDSGIEVDRLYDADDVAPGVEQRLGEPGSYPFTRGIHDGMYRDRLWTMRPPGRVTRAISASVARTASASAM